MHLAETTLGILLVLAMGALLPLGLRSSRDVQDLSVTVPAPAPHEIAPRPSQKLAAVTAGPPELLPRLEQRGVPDLLEPGLALRTWQVTYGRRWERQVTLPVLYGPFDDEGTPWPCAFAVRLAPSFFDDGKPGGADVESVLDRMVRAQFPINMFTVHFAPVKATTLKVQTVPGGLEVSGTVTLADGARQVDPTRFSLKGKLVLGEHDGDLDAKLEGLNVTWSGRTRHDPLVELAGIFMDVNSQARSFVAQRMQAALAILKLPKEPIVPFEERPGDKVSIRLCNAPVSGPSGLLVNLRVKASLAEPRVNPGIPGPTHKEAPPSLDPGTEEGAMLAAVASPAAIHQALYLLWQTGQLEQWGKRRDVVGAMRQKLEDRLAFDFNGLEVRLPPSVLPLDPSGALRVRFADVLLGRLSDGREAVAHGDVEASAQTLGGHVALSGALKDIRVDCISGRRGAFTLTPCFSDVVPVIRESGFTSDGLPLSLPIPDRLLRINLVLGTELVLRDLHAEMAGGALLMRASAALRPSGHP